MKHFATVALAAFVGVLGALLAYYLAVTKPAVQRELYRMEHLRSDARSVASDLEKAAESSVARAREGFESQARDERRRALVAVALSTAQGPKLAMSESYSSNLRWPATPGEAGLHAPGAYSNEAVRAVTVEPRGVLRVDFSDHLARGASMRLIPQVDASTTMISWRCEVREFPDLVRYQPQCRPATEESAPALVGAEAAGEQSSSR